MSWLCFALIVYLLHLLLAFNKAQVQKVYFVEWQWVKTPKDKKNPNFDQYYNIIFYTYKTPRGFWIDLTTMAVEFWEICLYMLPQWVWNETTGVWLKSTLSAVI